MNCNRALRDRLSAKICNCQFGSFFLVKSHWVVLNLFSFYFKKLSLFLSLVLLDAYNEFIFDNELILIL